jgi:hypothetical protein
VDVAVRRWEAFTGKFALLEATGKSLDEVEEERRAANDNAREAGEDASTAGGSTGRPRRRNSSRVSLGTAKAGQESRPGKRRLVKRAAGRWTKSLRLSMAGESRPLKQPFFRCETKPSSRVI